MPVININPNNGQQMGGLMGPLIQRCYTKGRKSFRACSGSLRWRYFDSEEECLQYLRTKHPSISLAQVHKIAY